MCIFQNQTASNFENNLAAQHFLFSENSLIFLYMHTYYWLVYATQSVDFFIHIVRLNEIHY